MFADKQAFVLPPKEDLRTLLPFFCLWPMFTTETLRKELGKEQKTLYIMLLKWLKRLLTLYWNTTMTEDFLAGLMVEWQLLLDKQWSSINKLGLNNGTFGNLLPALKNLGFRLDISQGPVKVIITISFAIISYILYRPVSHFLLL